MAHVRPHLADLIPNTLPDITMQKNLVALLLLIALSLASFLSAGSALGHFSLLVLMVIIVIKCALVGFQFMELKKAHLIWQIAFLSWIVLFTTVVTFIAWG